MTVLEERLYYSVIGSLPTIAQELQLMNKLKILELKMNNKLIDANTFNTELNDLIKKNYN